MDLWIAAHALSLNLVIVTHNVREFSRMAHCATASNARDNPLINLQHPDPEGRSTRQQTRATISLLSQPNECGRVLALPGTYRGAVIAAWTGLSAAKNPCHDNCDSRWRFKSVVSYRYCPDRVNPPWGDRQWSASP